MAWTPCSWSGDTGRAAVFLAMMDHRLQEQSDEPNPLGFKAYNSAPMMVTQEGC